MMNNVLNAINWVSTLTTVAHSLTLDKKLEGIMSVANVAATQWNSKKKIIQSYDVIINIQKMIIKFINTIAADKSTKDVCAEKKASIFVLFEF